MVGKVIAIILIIGLAAIVCYEAVSLGITLVKKVKEKKKSKQVDKNENVEKEDK